MAFKRATKTAIKLRLALFGPSGGGKTFTALRIASGIGGRIAVIDSERTSASRYSDRFIFDADSPERPTVDEYIRLINESAKDGYDVLIIDSLSHAWKELLQEVERIARSKYKNNSWSAWSDGTPMQQRLIDTILTYPGHVIVTMRSKTEWIQEASDNGRSKPVRVGLAPEQGKGIEYEFDILLELTADHLGTVIKDRTGKFQDKTIDKPGEDFGVALREWLADSAEPAAEKKPEPIPAQPAAPAPAADTEHDRLYKETRAVFDAQGKTENEWREYAAKYVAGKSTTYLANTLAKLKERAAKALIEEINGPIYTALVGIGVDGKDIVDKIVDIAKTEYALEAMDYPTLVEVRDGLNWWLRELKFEEAKAANEVAEPALASAATQAEPAKVVELKAA